MSRTLLVDTNRASYPVYQALLGLGHGVWVVGGRPDEPLAKLCPNYVQLDYSDPAKLGAFIDREGFDYLVPGCTDLSYEVCAELAGGRFFGIDSPENTRSINQKSDFRKLAEELALPIPRVLSVEQAIAAPSVIIKPVDSFSGRGMNILSGHNASELETACADAEQASRSGIYLIEEFVEGQLYSHSAFVRDGRIVADFVVREDCSTNPFTVDTSYVDFDFPEVTTTLLRIEVSKLVTHLRLVDGLVHTQFIISDGRYWLIEVTRRCPGDLYALLIEMSTGYPYGAAYAASFVGGDAPSAEAITKSDRIIRHTTTSRAGESLWGFQFHCPVDLRLFIPLALTGDYIKASPYGRAGLFFLAADSDTERDELYRKLLRRDLYSFNSNL